MPAMLLPSKKPVSLGSSTQPVLGPPSPLVPDGEELQPTLVAATTARVESRLIESFFMANPRMLRWSEFSVVVLGTLPEVG